MTDTTTGKEINTRIIVSILITGAFIAVLNQTLLATAIPTIMGDLNINASQAQWLTTVFLLVNGIMIPITAFLIETFTTRRLFMAAMGLFAIGTLIAAVSPTFSILIVGRIVQAMGAGIMMPLMQTVFLLIFPIDKRGAAMGLVGMVISFAPAIGPTLSGLIVDNYSWRLLFYIIFPIAIINLIVAYFKMTDVTTLKHPKMDSLSIILSTFGFGGLLYGFSTAGSSGWGAPVVTITLAVGVVSLVAFITRQLKLPTPILEFRVFKNPIFTLTTVITMIVFTAMIGAATILPLYIQDARGFTALQSGLILMPGAIVMGICSPITGRIFDKVGARWLGLIGMASLVIGTIPFIYFDDMTSLTTIAALHALRMLGMAMVMMPMTTAGLNQLSEDLIPHGTAMTNTMRQVAGSIGTAVLITIMSSVAAGSASAPSTALIEGVNIAFLVTAVISLLGLILSFFIKGNKRSKEAFHPVSEKENSPL